MPVKSTQNGGFANDVMAFETVLPAPPPDHEKARRRNGARMHVMLPVATNAIEGLQRASLTAVLTFPPKYLAPVVVNLAYNGFVHTQPFDAFPARRPVVQTPSRDGADTAHCFSPLSANILRFDRDRT
jgi:hypothetical protein